MSDTYANFAALKSAESPDAYSILVRDTGSRVVIAAPHGGGIEPGTSEVARSIAGSDLSYYVFEGRKAGGNQVLHITSSSFDEPQCLALLAATPAVVTVHGERSDAPVVFVGGRHIDAVRQIHEVLEPQGFTVREHTSPDLQGRHPRNICNLGTGRAGLQLELSLGLRKLLFESLSKAGRQKPTPMLDTFAGLVRRILLENGL